MISFELLIVIAVGALASSSILRGLVPFLRLRLLDQPNDRSSHCQPTPRGGGVSFVVVSVACALAALFFPVSTTATFPLMGAPLMAFPLALVGFFDDCYNISATWRYSAQLATAFIALLSSPLIDLSFRSFPYILLLMISFTAVINFTNFMDGLDGLLAPCMAIAISVAALKLSAPWPIWVLVGALLGFLLWNWSPAQVFMGDVGSTFLGAVFATLVIQASTWSEALGLLLVTTPLLGDACICVLRRLLVGHPVFQAHRLHLFQRLHQAGWPHPRVSSLYIVATAILAFALLVGGFTWVCIIAFLEVLLGLWLDKYVAVSFTMASYN